MTDKTAVKKKKETEYLLKKLDKVIERWKHLDYGAACYSTEFQQIFCDIDRARRRFESTRFFIVVFGPLKAGKSTLTNALAGDYVSPTGFGKETTRRPSLVMNSTESSIEQYFSNAEDINEALRQCRANSSDMKTHYQMKDDIKQNVKESFELVADYLREVRTKADIKYKIRIEKMPLNSINLEKALTEDLTTEPLFTVIRCKGGKLLEYNVVIVDMPGLDGSRSNWREDPIHEWVIKQADYFLFCQSSVAAINVETKDFVLEIVGQKSTRPPIYLVQNIFEARTWQPPEKQKAAEKEQREEGTKRLEKILGLIPGVKGVNLGKAWDGKYEKNENWLKETEFEEFETELVKTLQSGRGKIQEQNYLRNLFNRINNTKDKLNGIYGNIENFHKQNGDIRSKLNEAKTKIGLLNYVNENHKTNVKNGISTFAETKRDAWVSEVDNEIKHLITRHNCEKTGKEINDSIKNVAATLGRVGRDKYFIKTIILPEYAQLASNSCEYDESKTIDICNKLLEEVKREKLPDKHFPAIEDLPEFISDAFKEENLKEKKILQIIWDKKYNGDESGGYLVKHVSERWKQQIDDRKEQWVKKLCDDHFSSYCEKRRKYFLAHIERLIENFEIEVKPKEEAAKASKIIIDEMRKSIRELEVPLENANQSIKN